MADGRRQLRLARLDHYRRLAAVVGLAIALVISVYLDDGLHPFWAYVLSALGGAVPIALITLMIGVPLSACSPGRSAGL